MSETAADLVCQRRIIFQYFAGDTGGIGLLSFFRGGGGLGEVYRNVRLCTVMSEQRVAPNFWLNVGGNGIEKVKSEELCRAFRERTG